MADEKTIKDRGVGLPLIWHSGSFTTKELVKYSRLTLNLPVIWRGIRIQITSYNPFVAEEYHGR